jgi:hypothetical protein
MQLVFDFAKPREWERYLMRKKGRRTWVIGMVFSVGHEKLAIQIDTPFTVMAPTRPKIIKWGQEEFIPDEWEWQSLPY